MRHHYLKILPEYYEAVKSRGKTLEVYKNDRDFKVGDIVHLREYTDGEYTGRELVKVISRILDNVDYCKEDEVEDMKKILNNGLIIDTNCARNRSTAENDYVSMLERFINTCYPDSNYGFFGLNASRAEAHVDKEMSYFGYNTEMVNKALLKTINDFKTNHKSTRRRLQSFVNDMLSKPHKDCDDKYYSNSFRFVLTLILGYLHILDSIAIIDCPDPKSYFEDKVSKVSVADLTHAVNKTRAYVKKSNDSNLSEGMRMFDQWIEELAKEKLPPKELTIADIEKQLGYKIKIVGEKY